MLSNEYQYTLSSLMSQENKPVDRVRRTQILSKIIASLMLLYTGFELIFLYKPTNSELSLEMLIKYLNGKGVIEDDMFSFLQKFKPHKIDNFLGP
jgi:hypothetical protein